MQSILEKIVERKRKEVALQRERVPTAALEGRLATAPVPRDFFAAVSRPGQIRLIAEFKRKSRWGDTRLTQSAPSQLRRD